MFIALVLAAGFGFGLLLGGGMIDDRLMLPLTAYWIGTAFFTPAMLCLGLIGRARLSRGQNKGTDLV